MTHRYLETMAAGCIPWGHAPEELCRLFEYNPVLEIDRGDPLKLIGGIRPRSSTPFWRILRNTKTWLIGIGCVYSRPQRGRFGSRLCFAVSTGWD